MSDTDAMALELLQENGLISGGASFTGLGSGSDMTEVVDRLVAIESIQKTRLEVWKATWESKVASMKSLNQRLDAIEEAAGAIDTKEEFMAHTASSSNTNIATATASSSAANGAYNIEVAENTVHILTAAGVASTATTITGSVASDLVLEINSTQYTISLGANASLASVVESINAAFSESTVVASITDDGTSSNNYRLTLTAKDGGTDNRINVSQSPLLVSLNSNDAVLNSAFTATTSTSSITVGGQFTGDKADTVSGRGWYSYSVSLATTSDVTIGVTEFALNWSVQTATTLLTGSTTVGADYSAGDNIELHEWGLNIQLGSGVISGSDSFTVTAYANDIDDPELNTWAGTTVTSAGNYLGSVNKTYSFTVVTGASINDAGTAGTAVLRWTDSTGDTGTVTVTQSSLAYVVDDGVEINFTDAGELVNGDTFTINVFAPDQQQSQDKGLAQVAKAVHSGFTDTDVTPVTTSDATFTYTYGGETVSVDVDAGVTLSQLIGLINNDAGNPGVTASIINDGLGLPDSYKLVLTGKDTGAQYQITNVSHTFSGSTFGTDGDLGGGFTRSQYATNSMVKVDGYPPEANQYLQRENNALGDVIPGVSVSLRDTGSVVITIGNDISAIQAKIEAFINAVNYAQSFIREETKYDAEDSDNNGVLIGNYTYYIIKSRIDTALNESISGLADGSDAYTHLSQIGIHTDPDADGSWVIDTTELTNALNADVNAVANLFIENTVKGSTGAAKRMYDEMVTLTDSQTGALNVLIDNYGDIISNIDNKIESEERRIALFREREELRFARLETALTELNSQSETVQGAIDQLPSTGS